MSKPIYLCTCKDGAAYEEEKLAFAEIKEAEAFLEDCIQYAFDEEAVGVDNNGLTRTECLEQWHMECGDYSAKIELIELFD